MDTHTTDRFISGALIGLVVTVAAMLVFRYLDIPYGHYRNTITETALPVVAAACILLSKPLMFKAIPRLRRDPLLFDEDLDATLTGRALGLIGGFFVGIALCEQML